MPEVVGGGLLEPHRGGFLQRRDRRVADAGVGGGDGGDQFGRADQVADAPAGGVEVFPALPTVRVQAASSGERVAMRVKGT